MVLKTLHPAKFFTPLLILLCLSLSADGQQQVSAPISKFSCFVQAVTATTQCQAAPAARPSRLRHRTSLFQTKRSTSKRWTSYLEREQIAQLEQLH